MPLTRPKGIQVDTTTVAYQDTVMLFNTTDIRRQGTEARPDQGIIFSRPGTPPTPNIGLIWDEPSGVFRFVSTYNTDSVNGQVTAEGFIPVSTGDLSVTGNVTATGDTIVTGNIAVTGSVVMPQAPLLKIYTGAIPMMSGTTLIPSDNTTPGKNEGTEMFTVTVTPSSVNSKFTLMYHTMCDTSSNNKNITAAIFRGNTCIHASCSNMATAGRPNGLNINITDSPNTASDVTYSVRVGVNAAATWYINSSYTTNIRYNGAAASTYILIEHN